MGDSVDSDYKEGRGDYYRNEGLREEARRLAERLRRDPHSIVELGVDKQIIRLLESLAAQPPSEASKYGHSDACPKNCDCWNEA